MEEKPIFKLNRAKITVGSIDVNGDSEWELLIKTDTNDLPKFLHYNKKWSVVEIPAVTDADGNITQKAIEKEPIAMVYHGFIKDDKFVVTKQLAITATTFHEAYKKYKRHLEISIDDGYKKDFDRYLGDYGQPQQYYANERTPMLGGTQGMTQKVAMSQLSQQGNINQPQVVNVNAITKKKKTFGFLDSLIQANSQQNP